MPHPNWNQYPHKKPHMIACTWNPSTVKAERYGFLGFISKPMVSIWDSVTSNKLGDSWGMIPEIILQPSYMHTHVYKRMSLWLGIWLSGRRHHSSCVCETLGSILPLKIESGVCSGVFVLVVVVFIMQGLTQYQKTSTYPRLVPSTSYTCLSSWLQMRAIGLGYARLFFKDGVNVRLVWPKAHNVAQPGLNLPASPSHLVGL